MIISSVNAFVLDENVTVFDDEYTYNVTTILTNLTSINITGSEEFYIDDIEYCDYPGRLSFSTDRNCTRLSTDYYNNQSVLTPSIYRHDDMTFQINILKNPPSGNYSFDVVYYFYNEDDVLDTSIAVNTSGLGINTFTFSSDMLLLLHLIDVFDVYTQVSMLDVDGTTYTFDREFIGQLEVVSLSDSAKPQYYDFDVDVKYDKFLTNDKILFTLEMINKGDRENVDSILSYYLIDPTGRKFQLTKEVITFPKGTTYFERSIDLPIEHDIFLGNWTLKASLETTIQGLIEKEDYFEVVGDLSIIEKIKRFESYINWVFVWIISLILLIIFALFLNRNKKKEKKQYKEIEEE